MSPAQRCDEILRLIDEVLHDGSNATDETASDHRAAGPRAHPSSPRSGGGVLNR